MAGVTDADRLRDAGDAGAGQAELHLRPRRLQVLDECWATMGHGGRDRVPRRHATRGLMSENTEFARLVSLACHDLRTPLATVYGFARTLTRSDTLGDPAARYVEMIESSAQQMTSLLDDLGLAARIESGRYEPVLQERDALELAQAAAERAGENVSASGVAGERVAVDAEPVERALAHLAVAALRHGGVDAVAIEAADRELRIAPVNADAAPVVLAEQLKDLGAAIAGRLLAAIGGGLELDGETLVVRLPG